MLSVRAGQNRAGMTEERDQELVMDVAQRSSGEGPSGVLVGLSPIEGTSEAVTKHQTLALHVLVVDDDNAVRKACLTIAEGMGCAAVGAETLAKAWRGPVTSVVFERADHNDIASHARYWPAVREFLQARTGSVKEKVEPLPGALSTRMLPP